MGGFFAKKFLSVRAGGDWLIDMMPVITNLWKDKVVYAFVTVPKNGKGSRRLFLCTVDPRTISFDWENSADKITCYYGAENIFYNGLPIMSNIADKENGMAFTFLDSNDHVGRLQM